MIVGMKERISVKLFAGFALTSELRMHLKQVAIRPDLIEAHHEKQNYIGRYVEPQQPTIKTLRLLEQELKQILLTACPKFPSDKLQLITFSQVFIV